MLARTKKLHADKSSCSSGTCPTRFSLSDSELSMRCCPKEQVNNDFPGEAWQPLGPPASALWLSFKDATGTMGTFYPSSSKIPWIFLNVKVWATWKLVDISFHFPLPFLIFVFFFCTSQFYFWLFKIQEQENWREKGKKKCLKLGEMKGAIIVSLLCNTRNSDCYRRTNKNWEMCVLYLFIQCLSLGFYFLLDTDQKMDIDKPWLGLGPKR